MKPLLFVAMFLLGITINAQNQLSEKCKEGMVKAQTDFEKGELYFDYNLIEIEFNTKNDFESFYQVYLFSKYGIRWGEYIDYHSETDQCYYRKMDSLLREKFGEDIFIKSRRAAKKIHDIGDRKVKSSILDLTKFYIYLESPPKFIGNDMIVKNQLQKMFERAPTDDENSALAFFTLYIDTSGNIVNFESSTHIPKEKNTKNNILYQLNQLGKFEPAYLYDVKVKAKLHFELYEL